MAYPAEPWSLRGRMYVSVFVLPAAAVPALPAELAGAVRVVRIGGRAVIGAAWVDYRPGGDLSYRELLAAVLVRAGLRPRVTITHIWVDSVESRDGGRALWGIPKDLATFELTDERADAAGIAGVGLRGRPGVRLPIGFRVVQALAGAAKTTPVRATARCGPARVRWAIEPGGPLAFLAGRRPILSLVAGDFRMRFGQGARSGRDTPKPSPASS
ncbi:acetoacetate decarboxylase family protein [Dactylosporangium sp. CA-139066]|uniref:acetoacetate decarboxylase family protein n=1 Tax=Dactylosporangium sp. CA-139066 TaxID=3239930 RepID=UPI003D9309A2